VIGAESAVTGAVTAVVLAAVTARSEACGWLWFTGLRQD
jgi:hypothetical protein